MKILLIAFALINSMAISNPEPYKYAGYETCDTNYYNGEVLGPDMIHDDIRIVTDAEGLNWAMEYSNPESDGDLLNILREYTKPK